MVQSTTLDFLLVAVGLFVQGANAWEYCKTCNNDAEYCEFGCCGEGETKHCCENKIAIGVGTAFAALVLILVASGSFLIIMQRRYYRVDQKVQKTEASTQYDKDPLRVNGTVYIIGPDNRLHKQPRGMASGAEGGTRGQPPPAFVLKMMEKKSAPKKEEPRKEETDEEGGKQQSDVTKEGTPAALEAPTQQPPITPTRGSQRPQATPTRGSQRPSEAASREPSVSEP